MKRFLILNNLLDKIISSLSHKQPIPAFNKTAYHNWRHFYRHNKRKVF